jgi:chemotaxis protein CheY-P-specific phosphatase CheC
MEKNNKENIILGILQNGFERAAFSFSGIILNRVTVSGTSIKSDEHFALGDDQGDLFILTTQLMGDLAGKSYLILNFNASQEIKASMGHMTRELHEAALLEIDNIVSASVISDLSNALGIELYGDVPHLIKIHSSQLRQFLQSEGKDSEQMIFAKATFNINSTEKISSQFIWKLSSNILDMIAA